ncbi:peptidylprolyl isomerase [Roseobacter denitrificans]|uniref:Peptidyl-prolyl cis-trans isomerse D, putative n=1 Tax=Roseobacter denitrificans (strain ATCC 33942 / OCh 114) TaxID=375451 RepID=Q163Y6_ROSDO|nr:peptidyl-prolyl cis-trans isomerase [Roseobacter denitrificans]ABG32707.1 peptidyl-prolyl cis-trans isomerse D, putative [Roseobacter denitrificans OCh 114]AVL52129.1 peptidylprolyl isomerase [Roseobacter denitrificans]SFF93953.1 peptidyl-prolyl cis-trans isomerase D [Roseobacter denitrificans OCh 114]
MIKGFSLSKTAIWILMGLLILGLAGFGATNMSGNIRTIGTAGDKPIPVDDYFRQLQQEIRAVEQQTREVLPFQQAQQMGLDRAVLQRLVATRSLDHETSQLGLSIGDEELRRRILDISAFQGINGEFDREGYRFALEQTGLSEAEFETQLREEVARTIVQGAVLGGIAMPETYVDTLVNYIGEQRSFTWSLLDASDLATPLGAPDDAVLRAHYDDNIDVFTLPETKQITYAWLTPDMLLDSVEVDEEALREAYAQQSAEFNQPERRLVERLAFLDRQSAQQAADALAAGDSFDDLVRGRGLALEDIDLGDVSEAELGEAGAGVFAADVGAVVGPFPSTLGPALFRVNAVLAAQETPFEDAIDLLRPQLAADRASRLVAAQAESFDDLLAAGATLEDLASETDMVVAQIDWTAQSTEEIAAYPTFRQAAAAVGPRDFPEIASLDDGGLFALRLDTVLPPRPAPFDEIREEIIAHWEAAETAKRLAEQVAAQVGLLENGSSFADLGLDAIVEENLIRSDFVPRTPPGFLEDVFAMEVGKAQVIESDAAVILVRLDAVAPPAADGDAAALRTQLEQQASQQLARDIFEVFANDVVLRADPQINQQALQAVHVNFP